jgi:hypothetical protein
MGSIPVSICGQKAANVAAYLHDLVKEGSLTVTYTLAGHKYSLHVVGEGCHPAEKPWTLVKASQYDGGDMIYPSGPWHGQENCLEALSAAVASVYYHGGKLWAKSLKGPQELVATVTAEDAVLAKKQSA